ncbi:hypothetical protein Nepgr_027193 [Nepenthes gracilis]|uniref:Uncharacterized protein n=1 Tax=Nepenthes gracilis TaxID=150966 RepID=A0AAD3Y2Q4_NEPGR|nr:hypothetical protein Nepgr_027193 [Nepenthes gracilis]
MPSKLADGTAKFTMYSAVDVHLLRYANGLGYLWQPPYFDKMPVKFSLLHESSECLKLHCFVDGATSDAGGETDFMRFPVTTAVELGCRKLLLLVLTLCYDMLLLLGDGVVYQIVVKLSSAAYCRHMLLRVLMLFLAIVDEYGLSSICLLPAYAAAPHALIDVF